MARNARASAIASPMLAQPLHEGALAQPEQEDLHRPDAAHHQQQDEEGLDQHHAEPGQSPAGAVVYQVEQPATHVEADQEGDQQRQPVGGQVGERAEHGRDVAEDAVADHLLDHHPVGGLLDLAEGGVHAEEGQQGDRQQPADAGVAVVDGPLVLGQQLADAQLAAGQVEDQHRRGEQADEGEGEQDQGQPGADVAEDHRDPQGQLGTQPAEQVDGEQQRQQAPPHPRRCRPPGRGGRSARG